MIDLGTMSVPQLIDLKAKVEEEIKQKRKSAKTELLAQFAELSKNNGLTLEEVIGKPKAPAKPRVRIPPKYRNPENQKQTWSGRGTKPSWIVKAIDQGKKLEDFEIQSDPTPA